MDLVQTLKVPTGVLIGIILMPACCTPESLGPKNWASVGALLLFAQAVNKKIPAAAKMVCNSFFK
jgi:uncharacterized membrane protein